MAETLLNHRGPDPVDTRQVHASERIPRFLETVTPGQKIAFMDFDGTWTKQGVDVEDFALKSYLIPPTSQDAWLQTVKMDDHKLVSEGSDDYLVTDRGPTRRALTKSVTSELAELTGLPEAEPTSAELLRRVGRETGAQLIERGFARPGAIDFVHFCEKHDVRVVILTATPADLGDGILESFSEHFGFKNKIDVIGTEFTYDEQGEVEEHLWMRQDNKIHPVEEAKKRGAVAVAGAGDKPNPQSGSDKFMHNCMVQIPVTEEGDEIYYKAIAEIQASGVLT